MEDPGLSEFHMPAILLAASICTALACVISVHQLYNHLKSYTRPTHQRCIVRILFMVPLYAILSLLSLAFQDYQTYIAIVRDSYESYALYMFFALCINFVGGVEHLVSTFMLQPRMKLLAPLWCFIQPDEKVFRICRQGILQYALLRPMVSLASALMMIFGIYNEGEWKVDDGFPYFTILNNICVTVSLYCLALFYKIAQEELKPYSPVLKFAAIKMVIFFCYWQSVAISIAVALGLIPKISNWNEGQVATMIQNALICFEMFLFSVLHIFAFPYDLYKVNTQSQKPLIHEVELGGDVMKSVAHSMNQKDMVKDTIDTFVARGAKKKPKPKVFNPIFELEEEEEMKEEPVPLEQEPELIDDSAAKTARR